MTVEDGIEETTATTKTMTALVEGAAVILLLQDQVDIKVVETAAAARVGAVALTPSVGTEMIDIPTIPTILRMMTTDVGVETGRQRQRRIDNIVPTMGMTIRIIMTGIHYLTSIVKGMGVRDHRGITFPRPTQTAGVAAQMIDPALTLRDL
jgi:hypothetical protein